MQKKKTLTIIDTGSGFASSMEDELVKRYFGKATIRVITDPAYMKEYFRIDRKTDLLIINQEAYADFPDNQEVGHFFMTVSEIDMDASYPENVTVLMQYLPEEEIFQKLDHALFPPAEEIEREEEQKEEHETRVLAVYSPIGGCGKSLAAYAIARKLKNLDEKVLLISCDTMQSLSVFMENDARAGEDLAEALKNPNEDTYWTILKYIEREEISWLLPFEKSLPLMDIGMKEWGTLIDILLEKKDFDYLVLDFGSVLDREGAEILQKARTLVLLTENNAIAGQKMQKLLQNTELLPESNTIMIANDSSKERTEGGIQGIFGTIPPYPAWQEVLEDPLFYRIALKITE